MPHPCVQPGSLGEGGRRGLPPPFPSRYRRLSAPAAGAHCTRVYRTQNIAIASRGAAARPLTHVQVCTVNPTIWRCGLYRRVLRQGMQRVPCAAACLRPFVLHPVQPATAVHAQRALPIRSSAKGKIREKNKCLSLHTMYYGVIHALHHLSMSSDDDDDDRHQTSDLAPFAFCNHPHPIRTSSGRIPPPTNRYLAAARHALTPTR